jgi:hypothetical protein
VHAGNTYIKGTVYESMDPSAGVTPGVRVALGGADGVNIWEQVKTDEYGQYTFTLSSPGQPGRTGTWYV